MSALGNVLWIILGGGLVLAIEYFLTGILLALTLIGIPFGVQCIKLSSLSLLPFGKEVRTKEKGSGCVATLMNIIWIFTGGILISITHLIFGLLCAITIIGIPFAKQHVKLAGIALAPFGKEVVSGGKSSTVTTVTTEDGETHVSVSGESKSNSGLLTGLFIVLVLVVLGVSLCPRHTSVRDQAQTVSCRSNMRSLASAQAMYYGKYNTYADRFSELEHEMMHNAGSLRCPTCGNRYRISSTGNSYSIRCDEADHGSVVDGIVSWTN